MPSANLEIRPAVAGDLPRILDLYRHTMGGLPQMRSEAYWKWKHLDNPFGPSPVMLAFEAGELIGLRVFLRWQFLRGGQVINAFRAVDTATHPAHRGKGIFTALTIQLLDHLKAGPPALIYNTPNSSSKPGYLKMGWQAHARTRLVIGLRPLARLLSQGSKELKPLKASAFRFTDAEDILDGARAANAGLLTTNYSPSYLQWRYGDVPVADYHVSIKRTIDSGVLLIHRVKQTKRLKELRICDAFLSGPEGRRLFREEIDAVVQLENPDAVTLIDGPGGQLKSVLPAWYFRADRFGLDLTLRELNDPGSFQLASDPDHWQWSAGTLELF